MSRCPDPVARGAGRAWPSVHPDSAFAPLRRGVAERDPVIPLTPESSRWDPLRQDPRWPVFVEALRGR